MIRYDTKWYDMIRNDAIRCEIKLYHTERHNTIGNDAIQKDTKRYYMKWNHTTRYDMTRYHIIPCHMIRYNTKQYDMIWYDTLWCGLSVASFRHSQLTPISRHGQLFSAKKPMNPLYNSRHNYQQRNLLYKSANTITTSENMTLLGLLPLSG